MADVSHKKSKVLIIGMTDRGEQISAAAGRISTQEGSALEILEKSLDPKKNASLISKVTRSGHNSVIEHSVFNLAFENVSVFAEQFIIEFRLASFIVKSRRYVDFSSSGYYTPNFKNIQITNDYKMLCDYLFGEYSYFCERGIPKEDARFLLPYCLYSNFYCTVNARELLHMLKSMLFGRGSRFAELKAYGEELFSQLKELVPGICSDFYERAAKFDNTLNFADLLNSSVTAVAGTENEAVQLLSYTPDAARLAAKTALIATNQLSCAAAEQIAEDDEVRKEIIRRLIKSDRPRALENAVYTFRVGGVSLSTLTHFTRHRIQSIDIPLLTFTDRSKYILPPSIAADSELLERYHKAFEKVNAFYNRARAGEGSEEELVYCQLSGNTLDIILTMNIRELLLFFKLRTCTRAQWEIRDFAFEMLKKCREAEPEIFDYCGPGCYTGYCPEGAMSCKRAAEMRELFTPDVGVK